MQKKKYLLFIHMIKGFGGAERRLIRIYNEISRNRSVDLIIRGLDCNEFEECCKNGDICTSNFNNIICYKRRKISDIKFILHIIHKRYTVVHFFDYSRVYHALSEISEIFGIKTICTVANYFILKKIHSDYKRTALKLLRKVSWVDLLYPSGVATLKQIRNDNFSITPGTFTDLDLFSPHEKRNIILFAAARLNEQKNPMLLIEACNICQVELRNNKYEVFVLGKDYLEEKIKEKIKEYGIEDIVKMLGYSSSSEFIPIARVFTSLQKEENYPSQSVVEAYASGCYVIATDVGDTRRFVDENCSVLIHESSRELADAIVDYILKSDKEKENLLIKARQYAEKAFSIDRSIRYFEDLLTKISI